MLSIMMRMVSFLEYVRIRWSHTDDFAGSSYKGDRILRDCFTSLRDFACDFRNSRMGCKIMVTSKFYSTISRITGGFRIRRDSGLCGELHLKVCSLSNVG